MAVLIEEHNTRAEHESCGGIEAVNCPCERVAEIGDLFDEWVSIHAQLWAEENLMEETCMCGIDKRPYNPFGELARLLRDWWRSMLGW